MRPSRKPVNERKTRLAAYERKRDRATTPEPFGGARRGGQPIFVVQKHAARSLHYDFRLERDGVLASWAVPKGVPLEAGAKALAVHVEDHPLEYASFEGEIPKGYYGGGHGRDLGPRHLRAARGEARRRAQGAARTAGGCRGCGRSCPAHLDGKEANWLLIRKPRRAAATRRARRDLQADARDAREGAARGRRAGSTRSSSTATARSRYLRGGDVHAALAQRQRPDARASRRSRARSLEPCDAGRGHRRRGLRARRARPAELLGDAAGHAARSSTTPSTASSVDGEPLVGPADRGAARAPARRCSSGAAATVLLSEASRTARRCSRRRAEQGLEGVVAKRARLALRPGPADARLAEDQDARPPGVRDRRLHARLGQPRAAASARSCSPSTRAASCARSATSAPASTSARSTRAAAGCSRRSSAPTSPFRERAEDAAGATGRVTWVEPRLVAEVEFSEWTHDGHSAQPSYKGLRDDKPARGGAPRAARGRRRSARASASCGSPTSTSSSGPTRGSPRAT